ncbi:MFS transporter [Steroidobacter sp.]|uniref:MFS transporter n=1 Tax=Steroidobacter sp. TaxID=1978227 RepID=UPI001A3B026B|nr:MFS transporter [Steroidobacter sp.]MBL8267600.1 MFS transporter [Steroidobacter sp.]
MSPPSKLLLVLSFVGFIALGLPDAVIGVAWPAIRTHFALPQDALGPLFITVTVGSVMASTATGVILSRMGIGDLLALSCALTAISLFGYSIAPSWFVMVGLGLLTGFGAGAIDAAINTHAATRYSARLVNVLHAFYGVGAAAGPALMTAVLTSGREWQLGYRIIVAVEIVLAVAFVLSRAQWPPPVVAHEEHHRPAKLLETLRLGKVQLSLVVFFIYTGCEAAAGAWVFSLLYEARDIAMASAGTAVTLYWGGLFASRLGYAFLPRGVSPDAVIKLCIIVALVGVIVLASSLHPLVDATAIALVGFASGPIFPSLIATTPARVGPKHTANTVGLQVSIAAVGLASIPALSGLIAQHWGLELIPVFLTVCWSVLLAAYLGLRRFDLAPAL